jgi:hypothetical protein
VYLTFYWLYQIENDYFAKNKLKFYFLIIYVVVLYFSTNCHLILGTFNEYYDHFKVLTYGALLFIPILAISSPKKLNLETHS